jgi:hypothetical protein
MSMLDAEKAMIPPLKQRNRSVSMELNEEISVGVIEKSPFQGIQSTASP